MGKDVLTLFVRDACHLCEQAAELLLEQSVQASAVDVDDDLELGVRYGLRIPVLQAADGDELDWPFDAQQLTAWLAGRPV